NEFNQAVSYLVENWQAAKRPGREVLKGEYCSLVVMDAHRHGRQLFENLSMDNRGESWTYLPYGPFVDSEAFCAWIKETQLEKDTQLYAILSESAEPIGVAGYLRINPDHGVIEVGHLHYSKLLQRTPAATEAMYLMMQYAFEGLGYRRYEWKCHSLNEASRRAALRLGFQFEGVFRQCNVFKERNRDTAWFSIIDSEWPGLKEKFEKWLDKDNFDEAGKQRVSLQIIKS
ncbi:MAG: ribosomal-protein-serine acetyltransferase, partial [Gammaproteobacteria bacterium]|nr:ribosomal-protein-serine acetyltransferase [Gammaproteobacteria bacterium]